MPALTGTSQKPLSIVPKIVFGVWLVLILAGTQVLTSYSNYRVDRPQSATYDHLSLARYVKKARYSLILFLHPRCSCSRATLHELSKVLRKSTNSPRVTIVMYCPNGKPDAWIEGPNDRLARKLDPHEFVIDAGQLFQQNGIVDSGHVLCFDRSGTIRFSGGVTGSRSHEGSNQASAALRRILNGEGESCIEFPVFGCSIQPVTPIAEN